MYIPQEAENIWLSSRKFSLEGEVCNVAYTQVGEFGLCLNSAKKFVQFWVFEEMKPCYIEWTGEMCTEITLRVQVFSQITSSVASS